MAVPEKQKVFCLTALQNSIFPVYDYLTVITALFCYRHYEMVLLMGTVDWILKMNPQMSDN